MSGYQLVPEGGFRVYPLEGGEGHINRYFAQRNRFIPWSTASAGHALQS